MKNFLGKIAGIKTKKKTFYLSAFILICFLVILPSSSVNAGWGDSLVDGITTNLSSWINTFIFHVLLIFFWFASLLVNFSAWLVDMMLDPAMYRSILVGLPDTTTGKPTGAVLLGWQTIRDFCNMFYVFFLLLIAFSTIVGNQTYSAKSLLPKFIISIFLINFSAEITKMVIDVGQVFLFGMASWLGTFSGSQGSGHALTGIVDYFRQSLGSLDNPSSEDIISLIFAVLYTFALAAVYAALAGFLLFRLVMFAALIIVSPFAFFSMVLPSMGKYKTQWQSLLISNAISGPVLLFFVYISAMMAKNLVDHPIAVTAGDTSKMTFMSDILIRIVPHMVALGMLLFGIKAATSVGAAGSSYIAGGNYFGAGKMMGMGYAGFKLGERATRRAAGGARDAGVRNSKRFAQVDDAAHKVGQNVVGKVGSVLPFAGGTATNMILRDQASQDAAKKRMYDDRLKRAGGNLKAIDVDTALKGDNISKSIALNAAAEQGKLGDVDKKGNFKYAQHFREAESVMTGGDVKDLTGKNIAFAALTSENRNRKIGDGSFDKDAEDRMAEAQRHGVSPDKAVSDEVMGEKFMGLVSTGDDGKVQGVENEDVARVMSNSYSKSQFADAIKKMNKDKKVKLSKGLEANVKTLEKARKEPENSANAGKIEEEKMKFATSAIKSGSELTEALDKTGTDADYARQEKDFLDKMDADTIDTMQKKDLIERGHVFSTKKIYNLREKKKDVTLNNIEESVRTKAPAGQDKNEKIEIFDSFTNRHQNRAGGNAGNP